MPNISPFLVPDISGDERVQVFRRVLDIPGVFEGMEVDAYCVTTDRYSIVLDTLLCPEDVAAMLQQARMPLAGPNLLCINSHADWDHAWGNAYFTGAHSAPIVAHEHCRARLQSEEALKELEEFRTFDALFQETQLVPPTITFWERMTIHGGDLTIELLSAPGHHLDEIVAWIPEVRLLLAFDAVENPLPLIDGAQGVPLMLSTLERLIALQPVRVLCSHGKVTDPRLIQANLSYLREIERRCRMVLEGTFGPLALKRKGEQLSLLINYPFDEVIAGQTADIDRAFYSQAHEENIEAVLRWLRPYDEFPSASV